MKSKSFGNAPPEKPRIRFVRAVAVAAAAALSLPGCAKKIDAAPTPSSAAVANVKLTAAQRQNIRLYTVEPSGFHKTIETTGAVDFDDDQATSVLAPFSGPVSRLLVSLGDRVKKGEPLAAVDSPDFAAAVERISKGARHRQDRPPACRPGQGSAAAQRRRPARSDAGGNRCRQCRGGPRRRPARHSSRCTFLPQIIQDIQEGRPVPRLEALIRSPVAGTVVEKLITPGELLEAGTTPCFTVADLSRVWVMAQVFGPDLASVSVGDPAEVATGIAVADDFPGQVDNISALVDPDTRAVAVRVVVDNPQGLLKKQMYVRVRIESRRESTGLLVPVSAVLRDDENLPFVYLAQPDGSFARQHVTLGYRTGDQYDIPAGLKRRRPDRGGRGHLCSVHAESMSDPVPAADAAPRSRSIMNRIVTSSLRQSLSGRRS